jgi:hypothetical protein
MDEQPVQLLGEKREPEPMKEPHSKREQRTRKDWAEQVRTLADEDFPEAEKIILM